MYVLGNKVAVCSKALTYSYLELAMSTGDDEGEDGQSLVAVSYLVSGVSLKRLIEILSRGSTRIL